MGGKPGSPYSSLAGIDCWCFSDFRSIFRGREAEHPEFGQRVLDNFKDELSGIAEVESTSKPDGKSLTMVLAPNGVKK